MGENSNIEWTTHTFNCWLGCQKVGPGCDFCYAEDMMDKRYGRVQWGPHGDRIRTSAANWRKPLAWNKAAAGASERPRVFCASLADWADTHKSIPDAWRKDLGDLVEATPNLDWLLLTKRIGNADEVLGAMFAGRVPPNVWIGITVVNQQEADRDVLKLLALKAKRGISIAFLSMEPLLGPVDLTRLAHDGKAVNALSPYIGHPKDGGDGHVWFARQPSACVDLVIVGGESGPSARPMHPDWARSLRDQCAEACTPFFFKQWGEWSPVAMSTDEDGAPGPAYPMNGCVPDPRAHRNQECLFWREGSLVHWPQVKTSTAIGVRRIGKTNAGRLLDGREHNGMPSIPSVSERRA